MLGKITGRKEQEREQGIEHLPGQELKYGKDEHI